MNKLTAFARRTVDDAKNVAREYPRVTAAVVITAAAIAAPAVTTTLVATRGMIALIEDANRAASYSRFNQAIRR